MTRKIFSFILLFMMTMGFATEVITTEAAVEYLDNVSSKIDVIDSKVTKQISI